MTNRLHNLVTRLAGTIALLCAVVLCLAEPPPQWFTDIKAPAALDTAAGCQLAAHLRSGLLGKKKRQDILKGVPELPGTRVVFITLSDGLFPARTYFAPGKSLKEAISLLLAIIEKREPEYAAAITAELNAQVELAQEEKRLLPMRVKDKLKNPQQWDSLQLDIVQATLTVNGYVVPSSRLLLTTAVGLAFSTESCIALTPEQLTGRALINGEKQLSVPAIANFISEGADWATLAIWMRMGADQEKGESVTLFESDTYYADAQGARRLFRSRPVRTGVKETVPPLARATALAENLLALLDRDGALVPPFIEWQSARDDGAPRCEDDAALAIAFCRLAAVTTDSGLAARLVAAAGQQVRHIRGALKHYDADANGRNADAEEDALTVKPKRPASQRTHACFIEDEDFPEGSTELPRRIALLRSNAWAYLALWTYVKTAPKGDELAAKCRAELAPLHRHITMQLFQGGQVIPARLYPEMKPLLEYMPDLEEKLLLEGLCGQVMQAALTEAPEAERPALQKACDDFRLDLCQEIAEAGQAPRFAIVPEIAEFLATGTPSREALGTLARLANAAVGNTETAPMLPDMFGAPKDIPSMTYAARHLRVVCLAAEALAKAGQADEALVLMQEAWPLAVFQEQAFVCESEARMLPNPHGHVGLCRDNLADFGFTQDGQVCQLFSHLALAQTLKDLRLEALPHSEETAGLYEACWTRLDNHPICLAPELVILQGFPGPENARALSGGLGTPEVTTWKGFLESDGTNLRKRKADDGKSGGGKKRKK